MQSPLIFVVYDGIDNSVFEGQVIVPTITKLNQNMFTQAHIVSFEREPDLYLNKVHSLSEKHPRLHIHLLKKTKRFLGWYSINQEYRKLKNFMQQFSSYSLIARGPIAAILCQRALTSGCFDFTVQARGLLAKEFLYHHQMKVLSNSLYVSGKKILHTLFYWLRYHQLHLWEKYAYQWNPPMLLSYKLETVSPALSTYLQETYHVPIERLLIATSDIPTQISVEQKQYWRYTLRTELKIEPTTYVYVYNGSCKPWQCFSETVKFFIQERARKPDSLLLVLTPDKELATKILKENNIFPYAHVLSVNHGQVIPYICTADVGIILRHPHIINWVSRPTKALEYQAGLLKIAHNNTVGWLIENYPYLIDTEH